MSKKTNQSVATVEVLAPLRERLDAWAVERDTAAAAAKSRIEQRLLEIIEARATQMLDVLAS
jgi:hypothetical protein